MKRGTLSVAFSCFVSAAGSALLGDALGERQARASAVATEDTMSDEGNVGLFNVEVEPVSVLWGGNQKVLNYEIAVDSRFDGAAKVALAIELVDDRGRAAQSAFRPQVLDVAAGALEKLDFATRDDLGDGFYQIRVTAAMAAGDQGEVRIAERFFLVQNGEATPLSSEEWFQQSAANTGVAL